MCTCNYVKMTHTKPQSPDEDCKIHSLNEFSPDLLNIIHFNVRSLLPKISEYDNFLTNKHIHIISVNETWLDDSVSDNEISIPGFTVFRKDRNRQGGGVAFYIKNELMPTVNQELHKPSLEALWIYIKLKSMKFLICSLYRPPSADSDYLDLIFNNIEYATSFNENIIITGDLNIDYCNEKGPNFKWLKQLENSFSMEQLVYTPTRVTPSSSTIIDHILTSVPDLHIATGVLPYCSSDH